VDGTRPETCAKCGFDSRQWRLRDAADIFEDLGWWWAHATTGFGDDALNRRPAPAVWSVLEYGLHTALAMAVIRTSVEEILADNGRVLLDDFDIGHATDDNWAPVDRASTLGDLAREGAAMAAVAERREAPWSNVGWFDGAAVQAEAYLVHDVHDASHHFFDTARGLAPLAVDAGREGRLAQISLSDGGVPKLPVRDASVAAEGVSGDRQADRKHHGRPFQAVCLWSSDVIEELVGFGHPIAPGYAGENFTLAGLDWSAIRPGTLLRVGEALIELSFPAVPCHNQSQWFSDGDYSRIAFEVNPQWVRWYGWVREPANVRAGAPVIVGQ
jgi:MOSC domain-containing protein YiiM